MKFLSEAYWRGSVFSNNNDSYLEVDLSQPTVVLLYPKNFTPICTSEIIEINQYRKELETVGIQLFCGSFDSPESTDAFLGGLEDDIDYPWIHISAKLPLLGKYVNDAGYTTRTTVFIKDGEEKYSETVHFKDKRNIEDIIFKAIDKLTRGKDGDKES